MNWLTLLGAAAGAYLVYEVYEYEQRKHPPPDKTNPNPVGSDTFAPIQENPFANRDRIMVEEVFPGNPQLVKRPDFAQKWLLRLPGGTLTDVYCSFDKLKRKIYLNKPGHSGKDASMTPAGDGIYNLNSMDYFNSEKQ